MKRVATVLAASIALTMGVTSGAYAAPTTTEQSAAPAAIDARSIPEISEEEIAAAFTELEQSDLPRTVTRTLSTVSTTFTLEGVDFTFTEQLRAPIRTGEATPQIGGGWDIRGLYVSFNTVEQQAIVAGATAALAVAICFIPGVGTAACAVVSVVIAVATTFLVKNGICRNGKALRVYPLSRTARCA